MSICVQVFVQTYTFSSLRYIPRSGFAGSYSNCMFNFLRNCRTVLHSVHTILHSHQQCMRVPIFPHPQQHLLLSVFLIIAILGGGKQYLIWFLICNSLIINDVEHPFLYVFIAHVHIFFGKRSMQIFCPFLIGPMVLLLYC